MSELFEDKIRNKDRARARRQKHSDQHKKVKHRLKPQPSIVELGVDDKTIEQEVANYYNEKKRY